MNLDEIKELISVLDKSKLDELTVRTEQGFFIRLKRQTKGDIPMSVPQSMPSPEQSFFPTNQAQGQAVAQQSVQGTPPASQQKKYKEIRSPMVGTFYRSPSPELSPYVKVGDVITKGKTLCIIEAMKLMNEIESDVEGVIADILVENGKPVEYNQVLFHVE